MFVVCSVWELILQAQDLNLELLTGVFVVLFWFALLLEAMYVQHIFSTTFFKLEPNLPNLLQGWLQKHKVWNKN